MSYKPRHKMGSQDKFPKISSPDVSYKEEKSFLNFQISKQTGIMRKKNVFCILQFLGKL